MLSPARLIPGGPRSTAEAMSQPVFRFAPSPNGRLHRGHAYSVLLNEAESRRLGGRLLLRLEDIDPIRCTPALAEAVIADLDWLGVRFDGLVRRQSRHMDDYRAALDRLDAIGLIYPCRCTRGDIRAAIAGRPDWPGDPDGAPLYPGTCRPPAGSVQGETGEPPAFRLDMAAALRRIEGPLGFTRFWPDGRNTRVQAQPARWGDVVLARKDTPTSYHLAVVVDDALQGVTHVVRGEDLEAATDVHVLLQRLLGLPSPHYQFHPLIRDGEGDKLSKSRGSPSLASLRGAGVTAQALRHALGFSAADPDKGEPAHQGEDRRKR
jgi:glutamyl-Q tRNA(Asp) synthetase